MAELSFYIPGFYESASVEVIKSIRRFYPHSSIIISSDAGPDYYNIAKEFNCQFVYFPDNLGYPEMPHGYKLDKALDWLKRLYTACVMSKGTHIMIAEDDVSIINKITIEDHWEIIAHDTTNYVPEFVLDLCYQYSGIRPSRPYYGAGGGTILKIDTIINNYENIVKLFKVVFPQIQSVYPTIGWYDCYITLFYFLCGKEYTVNKELYEIKGVHYDFDLESLDKTKYSVVHYYKNFYPKKFVTHTGEVNAHV